MRRLLLILATVMALSPEVASACPMRGSYCGPPSGAPTSPIGELESAKECDVVASEGQAELTQPSSWLRLTRAAASFREVNEARDYAAEYRVRATRARRLASRTLRMRVRHPSALA